MKNIDIPRLKEIATNFLRPIFFSSGESLRKKYGAHYKDIFLNAVMAASYEKNLSSLLTKVCNMLGIAISDVNPVVLRFIEENNSEDTMQTIRENIHMIMLFVTQKS